MVFLRYLKNYKPTAKDKEVLLLRLDAFNYFSKARDLIAVAREVEQPFRSQYLLLARQMHAAARSKFRRLKEVTNACAD